MLMKYSLLLKILLAGALSLLIVVESSGAKSLLQQSRTVKGRVISGEDRLPVPGVSVLVKGTVYGTQTDVDGAFTLEIADDQAVIVISSIGFTSQEIAVAGRTTLGDIVLMPDVTRLDEIVVVGYGTQDRRDVTGSVATINPDQLVSLPVVSVGDALQGRAAGVQIVTSGTPGGDPWS
jgi:hypothetical protein